ncbi:hypothetical protein COA01_15810 [Bacillus cereus]|uniref:hypothetical protein n=1 Tax=Bacillus cereus TaxID=1396 RepID=UPI000BFE21ED|nr:hypothetical protein [Bacillus cereus]PGP21003.1 hypothetical protein COA01_15810 [Bacillus cereus]
MIKYKLKSSLLKFALSDFSAGDKRYYQFCKTKIKEKLGRDIDFNSPILKDYQSSSQPQSLGRHLLTDIVVNALGLTDNDVKELDYRRTTERDSMPFERDYLKPIIASLKDKFPQEYLDALKELRKITLVTRNMIRKSGKGTVELSRCLCAKEGREVDGQLGQTNILMHVNTLTSYTTNLTRYTADSWSNIGIKRYIPLDQVIIHPSYVKIVGFDSDESEAIIYNPSKEVIIQLPDTAFRI